MRKRETIDRMSVKYSLLRFVFRYLYGFYYREIYKHNFDTLPRNQSVIIASNHQNALMDAMAIVTKIRFQGVFLMRADVFKGKWLEKFLTFIKTLPIYRIRDGKSTLQNNDEIFDISVNVLHNRINPLCMFPEGNHGGKRRLRPLVKGIFRIAFKAQEKYKTGSGVKIFPIGLDYKHYQKFRQTLLMNFGEPVEVCEYWTEYEKNPSIAINKLKDRLAEEMKKCMIHIETDEYYDLYMGLRGIYNNTMCRRMKLKHQNLFNRFLADKNMIDILDKQLESQPEKIEVLNNVYQEYKRLREKLNFRDWVPRKKRYSVLGNALSAIISVVVLPMVILGLFNNWPHFFATVGIAKRIKDRQFHSTAKWGSGVLVLIFYYSILFALALILLPFWWLKILYIITLPGTGIFALRYRVFLIKAWARIRYSTGRRRNDSMISKFKMKYDELMELTDQIIDE